MARSLKNPMSKIRIPRLPEISDEPEVFDEMTLQEHLEEFRDRILKIVIGLVPAFIFGFIIHDNILGQMVERAGTAGFDARSPTDPITITFRISLYVAIGIMLPWIVYQVVAFLAPGLTRKEKRILYTALPFTSILLVSGLAYAWWVAIPRALRFLGNWNNRYINFDIDASETLNFFLALMVGLGLAFQLPLLIFIFAKIGIVSPQKLRKWRRYAYLVLLILSALITPTTDPFNLSLVAVPMVLLYELGIIIAAMFASTGLRNQTRTGVRDDADENLATNSEIEKVHDI